jgi:hypothetical protein
MYGEFTLRKVIGKLMQQIEEEKRLREETIRLCINRSALVDLSPPVIPTDEEIENRIKELSQ